MRTLFFSSLSFSFLVLISPFANACSTYYATLATRGQQFAFSNYKASKIQLSPKVKP